MFTIDTKNSSTLTQDNRTAIGSFAQDGKQKYPLVGRIISAFLIPLNLYNLTGGKPTFTLDARN